MLKLECIDGYWIVDKNKCDCVEECGMWYVLKERCLRIHMWWYVYGVDALVLWESGSW
jgi:hypothetical protein